MALVASPERYIPAPVQYVVLGPVELGGQSRAPIRSGSWPRGSWKVTVQYTYGCEFMYTVVEENDSETISRISQFGEALLLVPFRTTWEIHAPPRLRL